MTRSGEGPAVTTLVVSARTADGANLSDTYSLSGFTAAHKSTIDACKAPWR